MNIATIGKSNIYTSYLKDESQTETGIIEKKKPKKALNVSIKNKKIIIKAKGIVFMKILTLTGSTLFSELFNVKGLYEYKLAGNRDGCYILEIYDSQGNKETYKFAY